MTPDQLAIVALGAYLVTGVIASSLVIARLKPLTWPSWLRLTPTKDLLRQSLVAEVVVHILPDGARKVYATKLITLQPPQIAKVIESTMAGAMDLGAQHGITVHLCNRPDHAPPKGQP